MVQDIKTVSFIPAPAAMRELYSCQGKNGARASKTVSFIPAPAAMRELNKLPRQEWCKGIKTVSFIPAPATMRELTPCQGKNGARASILSASFQVQPP